MPAPTTFSTKPFGIAELSARLRAMLRRGARGRRRASPPVVAFGEVAASISSNRSVTRGGAPVHLTPVEFRLLAQLLAHPGKVLTHRMLLREVWGPVACRSTATICGSTWRICGESWKPIPARPRHLLTETGVGYRFAAADVSRTADRR